MKLNEFVDRLENIGKTTLNEDYNYDVFNTICSEYAYDYSSGNMTLDEIYDDIMDYYNDSSLASSVVDELESSYCTESLNEARNPGNDEINAIIRKNLGKKNISKKDKQALADAGIKVDDDGDMTGPNGRKLYKSGGIVTGPLQTYEKRKSKSIDWRGRKERLPGEDKKTSTWNLRKNANWADPDATHADEFDNVDLKGYLDKGSHYSQSKIDAEVERKLRPYSDDYKDAKFDYDYWRRDAEDNDDIMSDEDFEDYLEDRIKEFRQKLLRDRQKQLDNAAFTNDEAKEARQEMDDILAKAKAKHPQYESLNEDSSFQGVDAMRKLMAEVGDDHEVFFELISWLPDDMLLRFAEEWLAELEDDK